MLARSTYAHRAARRRPTRNCRCNPVACARSPGQRVLSLVRRGRPHRQRRAQRPQAPTTSCTQTSARPKHARRMTRSNASSTRSGAAGRVPPARSTRSSSTTTRPVARRGNPAEFRRQGLLGLRLRGAPAGSSRTPSGGLARRSLSYDVARSAARGFRGRPSGCRGGTHSHRHTVGCTTGHGGLVYAPPTLRKDASMHSSRTRRSRVTRRELDRITVGPARAHVLRLQTTRYHVLVLDAGQRHCTCHYFDSCRSASMSSSRR